MWLFLRSTSLTHIQICSLNADVVRRTWAVLTSMGRQRLVNRTVMCEYSASSAVATGQTHMSCVVVKVWMLFREIILIYYEVHVMRTHIFCWDHTHIRLLLKQDVQRSRFCFRHVIKSKSLKLTPLVPSDRWFSGWN